MSYPEISVLRHGETEWNVIERIQGRLDSPLTEQGQDHARAQGRLLEAHNLTHLPMYCSPSGRARRTAELALGQRAADLQFDERLMEIDMGDWQGRVKADLEVEFPHVFTEDNPWIWYDLCPGGEGYAGLEKRTASFLADLTEPSVLFTHGITSRFLRCHAMGVPIESYWELPGGQGIIHQVKKGVQNTLKEGLHPTRVIR